VTTCTPGPASAATPGADRVVLAERSTAHADAARLLAEFYDEQVSRYGFADQVDLDPAEYADPFGAFVLAYAGASVVGCGGYRWYDRAVGTVEIKKLYVVPAARGSGAGRALLAWLEGHAGARRAILETGVRNTAAIGLFTSAGYLPVDGYVAGRDPAINRAFARSLAGPG
jgi:GNAT superfamily N-acetyltransferase